MNQINVMLTKTEQMILLYLWRFKVLSKNKQTIVNSHFFYNIMSRLEKQDLVLKRNINKTKKEYTLTEFGELVACCISKLNGTPEKFKDNKTSIRWWFEYEP